MPYKILSLSPYNNSMREIQLLCVLYRSETAVEKGEVCNLLKVAYQVNNPRSLNSEVQAPNYHISSNIRNQLLWDALLFQVTLRKKERKKMKLLSRGQLFETPWAVALPGSSVHGIFQARILEWVAISFSRGSSQPRDRTQVSWIAGRCFTIWATREERKELCKSTLPCHY